MIWSGCVCKTRLHLFLLECCHFADELLGILGSFVVCELLLHVSHNLVLQLQAHGTLFLQLSPLFSHLSLVDVVFLEEAEEEGMER